MSPLSLEGTYRLLAGLLLGTAFGFFLIQSEMGWRKTLIDQLSMKNGKFFKVLFSSIAFGVLIFYFAKNYGLVSIQTRPSFFWGALIGGMLFAAGVVLCGQFPSSAVASLATGKFYSIWTLMGILLALPSIHFLSKWISNTIQKWPAPAFYSDRLEKMFSGMQNIYFYVAIFSGVMFLFFQFIQGGSIDNSSEEDESEK
ncbi:MAG TPA: YeeE/YedE thiosulfate transporter family protein [Victivallales bacterium]|nr:YeeE/YedE thiosulfate transporter family protein [Victivallales bacterium]HPO89550.1 YeeE/YedE thiosulfate transporter family protein [Victivallales bacterium]HRR29342.1 YeeE/YedE thiosulfate transporter family protein [Victivallales bacterium]HRU01316.1 YeeE/YedE thiosulfate transporter family protein [Victivallales bacterium]